MQVAEQGLPSKAIGRWFPYVATLMLFIWVDQHPRLHPAAADRGEVARHPDLGHLRGDVVALGDARARAAHVHLHARGGHPLERAGQYFKSWIPEAPKPLLLLIVPLEILGQFMRLISLSVRLFANMLAGHILILTFIGLMFILQSLVLAVFVVPIAALFYVFEVVIVVTIQAFIFAALSAIYIGSAIEPEH